MADEKEFNKEIIDTEDWDDNDYDDFLDYLEDLEDEEDDDNYEDDEDDEYNCSTSLQPMKRSNRSFTPTVQQQQSTSLQYDGNNQIGGFFNNLANNGVNIGISDNNGSGIVIGGNGIGINITPNTLINMSNSISNKATKVKYNHMKKKIKKEKERKKLNKNKF